MRTLLIKRALEQTPHDIAGPQPQDPYGVPTFLKWSQYYLAVVVSFPGAVKLNEWVHGKAHEI